MNSFENHVAEVAKSNSPNVLYVFGYNTYDGISVSKIIMAASKEECISKVMANYDYFDEIFMDNFTGSWSYGGLFEYISYLQDNKNLGPLTIHLYNKYNRNVNTRCFDEEDTQKFENDKVYRRQIVEENKDSMLGWLHAYWKDPEGRGICVDVCEPHQIFV